MKSKKLRENRRNRVHSPDYRVVKIRTEGKVGAQKTLTVGFFILFQLAILITLYLGIVSSFLWYIFATYVIGFFCCLHVLSSNRNGQSKTIWILVLLLFSSFGFIFYFFSLEKVFFGRAQRRYRKIFERTDRYTPQYILNNEIAPETENIAEYLYGVGKFATQRANMQYYSSGFMLFDDICERLKTAEKFVFIEFFIISDGILMNRISDILCEKALNGVDVRIIRDGMGSHGTLPRKLRSKLIKAGIKLYSFNPVLPLFSFALNLRDHRKIVVVDGKTAYTGGCNIADEYVNEKRMHGYWKDTGLKIEGAAVDGLTLSFLRQWEFVTGKTEDYSAFLNLYEKMESGSIAIPYADGKDYNRNICKGVYTEIMAGARRKLYIMTPYFIPDEVTADMLAQKALSGVDVRLILPGIPDKPYVYKVSVDNAERLLPFGVKVYKMKYSFVHSKLILSENCVSVGSANFDLRSFYNQFENGVFTDDFEILEQVSDDFEKTFLKCEQINEKNCLRRKFSHRLLTGFLRLFAPLM